MRLSRRQFVAATASSWLCAGLPRAHARTAPKGPRYFVTFFLRGGMDAVYTLDPKTRADVEANIDVPYGANEIVDASGMPFGPHFKRMAKWAPKMAIVKGVQVKTANHESGAYQMLRMRTSVTTSMPSLFDIIGQERDTQPLASVTLGDLSSFEHSPGAVIVPTGRGNTSLDAIDGLSDEDIAILARVYAGHLERFPKWQASPEANRTREHVAQAAAFFERMKTTPHFDNGKGAGLAEDMQRTLWFLENDLARGVCVKIFLDWDSHYRNADKQVQATGSFTAALDKFLEDLHSRKNAYGNLADQTVVVVGSELGRFPVINGNLGKDHFPESSYVFMGPNINVGHSFVPTGKRMEGLPVSAKTGKAGEAGAEHVVLDDLGTTMLHMAGMNPSLYGYRGRKLDFLVRA